MKSLISVVCLMLLAGGMPAGARTHVLFTVDVESFSEGDPAKQIWGEVGQKGERWGITRLMDIFEAAGVRATFYLNVYEIARNGEEPIRAAAREIHRRGHDLQLHSHPQPMFPMRGRWHGDLALQTEMLSRGMDLLRRWTGRAAIAHRASYRVDSDTLRAERQAGIPVDATFTWVPPDRPAGRDGAGLGNTVQKSTGVIHLPATYYAQLRLGPWASHRLVDIEGSTEAELTTILDQAARAGLCTVNIVLHSFSLSRYGVPDPAVARRLRNVLAYARSQSLLMPVTTTEIYEAIVGRDVCAGEKPFVPTTGPMLTYARAVEDVDKGWKNKLAVAAPMLAVLLLSGAIVLFFRRRQSQRRTRVL